VLCGFRDAAVSALDDTVSTLASVPVHYSWRQVSPVELGVDSWGTLLVRAVTYILFANLGIDYAVDVFMAVTVTI